MRPLPKIIEDAYEVFAPYVVGATLDVCKACCVTDAEEQALLPVLLRDVPNRLLNSGYPASAFGHSDQERWELKHFLPRLLGLISQYNFPRFTPEIMLSRLDLRELAH